MPKTIGKRIAELRQQQGWTQQDLASRLAISRVAVSHIEMDLTIPSERTITLLAGIFKLTPHELVKRTTYPQAKTERLPPFVCCYTELELDLAKLEQDLAWLQRLAKAQIPPAEYHRLKKEIWDHWHPVLEVYEREHLELGEKQHLAKARQALARLCNR